MRASRAHGAAQLILTLMRVTSIHQRRSSQSDWQLRSRRRRRWQ